MFKEELRDRFLRYAVIDTMSDEILAEKIHPSTEGQWDLLRLLESELRGFGIKDVELDEYGYLLARIPATAEGLPTIAFSSHVDTADDVDGNHVKPRVIDEYDGKDIILNEEKTIKVCDNKELLEYVGSTVIVSDGNTLLGADDKAGVAAIMTAAHHYVSHPEIRHGEIEILFSPDEETGFGMSFFDPTRLHSSAFYTVDGGTRYEVEMECFNAATVKVHFCGVSYHLGAARGRLVNAITMASQFISSLPQAESPEATDGRYGYYCAQKASGDATDFYVTLYLRDFDYDGLIRRIDAVKELGKAIEVLFNGGKVIIEDTISYLNMGEAAKKNPKAVEAIFNAGRILGQPLHTEIIRGGTDGSRIAQMKGIPCPNLYTGSYNFHSCYEWTSLDGMNDITSLIIEIIKQWAV